MNNIVLFGFRYTGKSLIGEAIAKINNLKFIDLDQEIEKKVQKTIAELTQNGKDWVEFRKLEFELLKYYINISNIVLSCGGGIGVNELFGEQEKNLINNANNSLKILLEIDEETLEKRERDSYKRPLINKQNIKKLWNERKLLYETIDYDLKMDSSSNNIVNAIKNSSLCCVIGCPIWHSLSPKIHNSCYTDLKIDDKFVYTKIEIKPEKFDKIKDIISIFNLRGISITSPYKEEILKYLGEIDIVSQKIGAVNTVLNNNGKLFGYNTDCIGVYKALEKICNLKEKKVAIFGSGGGAKSAVIGLLKSVKNITMFNRTREKNDIFAKKNDIKSLLLGEFNPKEFDIIINTTTVGLNSNESILNEKQILRNHIVFDMVYNPLETRLLKIAKQNEAKIVYGTEMLVYQAIEQFKLYTALESNIEIAQQAIYKNHHKICIVIVGNTIKEFIKNLKKAQKLSNFVELRTDYIKNISKSDINKIVKVLNIEAIFTCRMKKDGGNFIGTIEENKEIITYAISLNKFSYFDIDIQNALQYKDIILNRKNWKLILSYHNFNKLMLYKHNVKILNSMKDFNPDIKKIASVVDDADEIIDMIRILKKYKNEKFIFTPITENKILKLMVLKLDNWTNFFCLNEKLKTANGQLCFNDYQKIKNLLF